MAQTLKIAVPSSRRFEDEVETENVFERVRQEVDLHKIFPFSNDARAFDRYYLDHCINPEHPDQQMSLLVFTDGVRCQACGFRADAVDIYQMSHPNLNKYQCALALLEDGGLALDRSSVQAKPREVRKLDQDLAVRYHLALAMNQEAFDQLKAFGFTAESIRHFKLGWARVLVRLSPHEEETAQTAPDIEWREVNGKPVPFQWQWRYSVPVFTDGRLRQMLYRKANAADLGGKIQMEYGAGTAMLFNQDALDGAEMGVLCEGWGDAIVLWQAGIPAVTGISGAGQFREEWVELLGRVKRLYVVGDADEAGQKMMERVKRRLPWARPLKLPWEHGTKRDIRDLWLAGWRRDDFLRLLRQADVESSWKVLRRRK